MQNRSQTRLTPSRWESIGESKKIVETKKRLMSAVPYNDIHRLARSRDAKMSIKTYLAQNEINNIKSVSSFQSKIRENK